MFTTKEQFENSSLYKRYGTMPVEVLDEGYHCYATVEAANRQLVHLENTVAIAIQVNDGGLITMFRATGYEEDMTTIQKNRIFEFACDHIYGNGRSNNQGYFDKFVRQFAEKIAEGQKDNQFLLGGFNVGILVNARGGFKGIECSTTKAAEWQPAIVTAD